jgi:hypothetical protein
VYLKNNVQFFPKWGERKRIEKDKERSWSKKTRRS